MASEKFKSWRPDEAIPKRVEVESLRDEDDGLSVILAVPETRVARVKLIFSDLVAYRNINESFRIRTWRSEDFSGLPSLLVVEGSLWLKWLCEESGGILEEATLTHYAIYTSDDCIDVAATAAPIAILLDC